MTTNAAAAPGRRGGCLLLLDLPPGSSVTLDGVTRVTPRQPTAGAGASPLHRGLCIIDTIHSSSGGGFHLLVVRPGYSKDPETYPEMRSGCRTLPVGFALASPEGAPSSSHSSGYEWIVARRYDPRTEEISSVPVDDLTVNNMVSAIREGGELQKFVISYEQFMKSEQSDKSLAPNWEARTSVIDARFLRQRHGISFGDKIVPSSDGGGASEGDTGDDRNNSDGASVSYPPLPCIDPTINARRLAQHAGTRVYLSKLSPEKRTQLLSGGFGAVADSINPGERVWKDVVCREYGGKEDDLLGDIELSFLLTLFMECHASLEHWRDAVSMCSLAVGDGAASVVAQRPQYFQRLLDILTHQLASISGEFFQDVEYSAGEDNFLVGALRRLCAACESVGKRKRGGDDAAERLKSTSQKLRELVRGRFGLDVFLPESSEDHDMEADAVAIDVGDDDGQCDNNAHDAYKTQAVDDDSDEEDGPVIVPYDQVEESVARSSKIVQLMAIEAPEQARHRKQYPLLYAAMTVDEDEVMACARILDSRPDASLVREAAAYLEEVEAHRGGSF
ncbi:hypothetical protein ACHAXT_007199 [Thalassiosira profunda]